ncbi:hypothetical protein V8C86DRAFT_2730020 [Haematococcus lacustris]
MSRKPTSPSTSIFKILIATSACYAVFLMYSALRPRSRGTTVKHRPSYHKTVHHSAYKALLPELLAQSAPHYLLFTSGTLADGTPWCPDCAVSIPIVRSMVSDVGGSLLEVEVGSGSEWRDAQHPLRVDAAMPVKYVPTVYHYSVAGGAGARISNQLNSDATVEALRVVVAMFLRDTAGQSKSAVSYAQTVIDSKGKKCGGC